MARATVKPPAEAEEAEGDAAEGFRCRFPIRTGNATLPIGQVLTAAERDALDLPDRYFEPV